MNTRDLLHFVREQVGPLAWERMNAARQIMMMRAALCSEMLTSDLPVVHWREVHAEAERIIEAWQWGEGPSA